MRTGYLAQKRTAAVVGQPRTRVNKRGDELTVFRNVAIASMLALALSGCATFGDGVAAISGRGGTIARSDALNDTAKLARQLAPGNPSTAWETVFPAEAADFVQFIDGERVLVGTLEIGAYLGVPDFKKLILYDARSGANIWEAERQKLPRGRYVVLALDPHIVLMGTSPSLLTLTAFSRASGSRVWEAAFKSPLAHTLSQAQDRFFVLASEGARRQLRAVDPKTGRLLWSQDIPEEIFAKNRRVIVESDGGDVYVAGRKLIRLTREDGKILWTADPAELDGAGGNFAPVPGGLIAWSAKSMSFLDRNTGRARWHHSVAQGVIKLATLGDGQIFHVVAMDAADAASVSSLSDKVQSLDLKSGNLRWSREIGGTVVSQFAMEKGLLLLSLEEELVALQAATGAVQWRRSLPAAFRMASPTEYDPPGQPDLLRIGNAKLYLARESAGLIAYSLPQGNELWRQENYTTAAAAYPFSAPARAARLKSMLLANNVPVNPAPAGGYVYSPQPSFGTQRLQSQHRSLEVDRQRAAGRGDTGRVAWINNEMGVNQSMQRFSASIDNSIQIMNASVALSSAIAQALQKTALQGAVSKLSMEIDHAALLHHGAFQGRYYVRPFQELFYARMQGVTLVDLETGKRSDLVVSPHIETVTKYGIEIPQVALDPKGKRLITVGVGLKPERYQEYVAWKVRQARPSVLAYDVSALPFVDKNSALEKRLAMSSRPVAREFHLAAAATTGNLRKVQKLLDSGMDVNTPNFRGHTMLMVAADANNDSLLRLLLQRGAKVNVTASGLTALDFAKDPKIQKILRDAGGRKAAELK